MQPTKSTETGHGTRRAWRPPTVTKLAIGTQTKTARRRARARSNRRRRRRPTASSDFRSKCRCRCRPAPAASPAAAMAVGVAVKSRTRMARHVQRQRVDLKRPRAAMKAKTMRRVYLREAAVMLALARLAVRFVRRRACSPGPTVRRAASAVSPPRKRAGSAGRSRRSARAASALCLPRALAAHAMLRRRGIASTLCLGVAREGESFAAHAWIEIGKDKTGRRARSRRLHAPCRLRRCGMSAIAGMLRFDGGTVERRALERAANALTQYGPDRAGIVADGAIGLAHVLMRMTPEDRFDRQPERGASGALDRRRSASRQSRRSAGAHRRSRRIAADAWSDARVLLAAWEKFGDDGLAAVARAVRRRDLGCAHARLDAGARPARAQRGDVAQKRTTPSPSPPCPTGCSRSPRCRAN